MAEHYCEKHQCKFYRNEKGDSSWYSHKIKGTDEYCNEPKASAPIQSPAPPPQQAPVSPTSAIATNSKAFIPLGMSREEIKELIRDILVETKTRNTTNESIEFQVCLKEVGECIRWNEKSVPYAARTGYWKAICERLGTADLYEEKQPEVVKDTAVAVKPTTESHLVAEAVSMGGGINPTQQTTPVIPSKPATKSQTDAITKLMLGKAPVERADIYKAIIGREAPTNLSVEQASKVIEKLQAK